MDILRLLTPREQDCLAGVAENLSSKMIGRAKGLKPRTVDTHIYNAMRKMCVHDRHEAAGIYLGALRSDYADRSPRACYEPATKAAACFIMRHAKATT